MEENCKVERFKENGKYGLQSVFRNVLIKPSYDKIIPTKSEEVFIVCLNKKYGLYKIKNNDFIVYPKFDYFKVNNSADLIYVFNKVKKKWGLIDYDGKEVLKEFMYLHRFHDICLYEDSERYGRSYNFTDEQNRVWFIYSNKLTMQSPDEEIEFVPREQVKIDYSYPIKQPNKFIQTINFETHIKTNNENNGWDWGAY